MISDKDAFSPSPSPFPAGFFRALIDALPSFASSLVGQCAKANNNIKKELRCYVATSLGWLAKLSLLRGIYS